MVPINITQSDGTNNDAHININNESKIKCTHESAETISHKVEKYIQG